ncbi:MAG: hypothetical protein HYW37_00355 [Candidatus Colwellbacteria bacterium]|nr:hypothetical protein [Candidatus Colwellbacteria bacterium]
MEFRGSRLKPRDKVQFRAPEDFSDLMEERQIDTRRTFTVATVEPRFYGGAGLLGAYWYQLVTLEEIPGFVVTNQNLVPIGTMVKV